MFWSDVKCENQERSDTNIELGGTLTELMKNAYYP
jgi:hypothetical protein